MDWLVKSVAEVAKAVESGVRVRPPARPGGSTRRRRSADAVGRLTRPAGGPQAVESELERIDAGVRSMVGSDDAAHTAATAEGGQAGAGLAEEGVPARRGRGWPRGVG